MKRVVGEPHVFTAAGDEVFAVRRVEVDRAGLGHVADVGLSGKEAQVAVESPKASFALMDKTKAANAVFS